ncbi:MAG: sulfite exporter TauE/SafE family protein, partial [Candidatus Taylorbacteria bacterium]|nr:sulfite exporter TauE/SafE family protein [Candidatus Taylorbacteria bacterium]
MTELKKENYHISGMHCRSCEILVEDHISEVAGVKKVKVDYKKGVAEVYYENKPQHTEIEKVIRNAGYALGIGKKRPLLSSDFMVYYELIFAGGALFIVYVWLNLFGVFNLNLQFSSTPSLFVVTLIGLTAGISTCMALIGGLVLGISSRHAELHPEATASQKFKPHLFFNLGRLLSYAVLGGAIGLIGSVFRLSSSMLGFLIIFAGVVMFILGLKMTEVFPRLDSGGLLMPKSIARFLGFNREVKEYSHKGAFLTGILTFFLPCGFTQAVQIYAISTGSFTKGALIMFLFALGTMPGLLGIGGFTSMVKGAFARYFFKFTALVLLILAVWNISNGYNLTGITLTSFGGSSQQKELSGTMIDGERVVEITQLPSGYSPRNITVKKDVPVKLLV